MDEDRRGGARRLARICLQCATTVAVLVAYAVVTLRGEALIRLLPLL